MGRTDKANEARRMKKERLKEECLELQGIYTYQEIAEMEHISLRTVKNYLGPAPGYTKRTREYDKKKVIDLYKQGYSYVEIQMKCWKNYSTIRRWCIEYEESLTK